MSKSETTNSSVLIDPDRPDTVRMTPQEGQQLGMSALRRIGYSDEDARIIVDQLIDNALCGYRFASLPRILAIASDPKTKEPRRPVSVVQVEIEEGPRLTANLLDCPVHEIKIGMPVAADYEDITPEITLVQFRRTDAKG